MEHAVRRGFWLSGRVALWLVAGLLAACGSAPADLKFPTRERLATLGAAKTPPPAAPASIAPVDTWTLAGPFPDRVGADDAAPAAPVEVLVAALPAVKGVRFTAQMTCIARETARFVAERQGEPPMALRNHIGGRCGAPFVGYGDIRLRGDVPADVADDALVAQWRPDVERLVGDARVGAGDVAGVALARVGGRAVIVLAYDDQPERFAGAPQSPGADTVRLEGVASKNYERVVALVTAGQYGVAECPADLAVKAPAWAFDCPLVRTDDVAWVSVAGWEPDRFLGETVFRAMLRPSGEPATTWTRPGTLAPRPFDPSRGAEDYVALVNGVRASLGLAPVALEVAQSRVVAGLLPHFRAATEAKDGAARDELALGVIAGWDVVGRIERGHLLVDASSGSRDLGDLLGSALTVPHERVALLTPGISRVALALDGDAGGVQLLAGAYQMHREAPPKAERELVVKQLARQRKAAGFDELRLLEAQGDDVLKQLELGKLTPEDAVHTLGRRVSDRYKTGVFTWFGLSDDIEHILLPKEAIEDPSLKVAVFLGRYREPDRPWVSWFYALVLKR